MRPNQEAKRIIIDELKQKITSCKAFVIVDYKGLTVASDTKLRKGFREADIDYGVHKNTLVRIALNELGYTQFDEALNGPTAVAFSTVDELAPAKVTTETIEKNPSMQIKCGYMNGNFVDQKTINALARVPAKPVLLGMLANVLNAPIQGLAIALKAIADKEQA